MSLRGGETAVGARDLLRENPMMKSSEPRL